MFIWMEGSITVGDVVTINDLSGVVESIAIRTTKAQKASPAPVVSRTVTLLAGYTPRTPCLSA